MKGTMLLDFSDTVVINGNTYVRTESDRPLRSTSGESKTKFRKNLRFANANDKWTSEQDAELLRMKAVGMSGPKMGKELGRSTTAVWSRLNYLKNQKKA